jgi:regulator of replication initiation timing
MQQLLKDARGKSAEDAAAAAKSLAAAQAAQDDLLRQLEELRRALAAALAEIERDRAALALAAEEKAMLEHETDELRALVAKEQDETHAALELLKAAMTGTEADPRAMLDQLVQAHRGGDVGGHGAADRAGPRRLVARRPDRAEIAAGAGGGERALSLTAGVRTLIAAD